MRTSAPRKLVIMGLFWGIGLGVAVLASPAAQAGTHLVVRAARAPKAVSPIRSVTTLSSVDPDDEHSFSIDVVVTLPFSVIGGRSFTAKESGGDAGLVVRAFGTDALPSLATGDVVRVIGQRKGVSRGLPMIGTVGKKITRLSAGEITYAPRETSAVDERTVGSAVILKGTVTHVAKHGFSVSDDRGEKEVEVTFPKKAVVQKMPLGSAVEVRGVVLSGADGLQLVAAGAGAARVVTPPKSEEAVAESNAAGVETHIPHNKSSTSPSRAYWLAGFCALIALVTAAFMWAIRRRNALNEDIFPENR